MRGYKFIKVGRKPRDRGPVYHVVKSTKAGLSAKALCGVIYGWHDDGWNLNNQSDEPTCRTCIRALKKKKK